MGNCDSQVAEQLKKNRMINAEIMMAKKEDENVVKLLLLGAGESGKSTILKQMKIIHDHGFSKDESIEKKNVVFANTVQAMGALIDGFQALKLIYNNKQCQDFAAFIRKTLELKEEFRPLTEEVYKALRALWSDKGIQIAYERRDEFYLHDSAKYFLDSLERIYDSGYVPTEQDILHTRIPTMGVIEVSFNMKNKHWRVFDVGGQRSQRKKWIHCFDDAKALIYVASLSEYDQVLLEDNATNRMQESLQLFKQVINNRYFVNTSVILFLNKKDLFAQKIGHGKPLKIAFENYNGPEEYDAAVNYIERRYLAANENADKNVYVHHTCATDTEQVQFVLDSVLDTILSTKLKGCGLY
ncbi:unnamed protein product [Caenorhabditis auriculariae]|uniref:Guanine nucleotide-binding protein alpha-1 subunit n=1 Tax=Caenorhabditis auriculariae TaxID=2777116 RepID=A0A8S1HWR5_9PELO|nr:unnamed protein product [Caenorhabditis auriculariae]